MYKKKSLILAMGAALAVPCAYAQEEGEGKGPQADSVVTLYGKVYPEVVRPSGRGATAANATVSTIAGTPSGDNAFIKRNEMESSNTNFGIRGSEKVGPTVRAIFQLETDFKVDQNDTGYAQRDSFVGLQCSQLGTIKLGRMDTPFKKWGDEIGFLGVSSGNFVSTSNVMRKSGFGTNSASSFHLRRSNAVEYDSAKYGGLAFAVQYSTDESKTATRNPEVWSGAVSYEMGPLKASLSYETHKDLFGGSRNTTKVSQTNFNDQSVNSKDKAIQAMLLYRMGRHSFEVDFGTKKYDENASVAGRFRSYKNKSYQIGWDARWSGSWRTMVEYIHADKGTCELVNAACDTSGLDGSQIQAGVAYNFSNRTYLFAMLARLTNGSSARYNISAQQTPNVGEDITEYAVGINHSF
jgi:predicted porin